MAKFLRILRIQTFPMIMIFVQQKIGFEFPFCTRKHTHIREICIGERQEKKIALQRENLPVFFFVNLKMTDKFERISPFSEKMKTSTKPIGERTRETIEITFSNNEHLFAVIERCVFPIGFCFLFLATKLIVILLFSVVLKRCVFYSNL